MEQTTRYQVYKACPIPGIEAFLSYYVEGNVDKPMIEATLANALMGKSFDPYSSVVRAARIVIDMLAYSKKWKHLSDGYSLTCERDSPSLIYIYWKKMWIASITIRKKKGKYHRGYFGGGSYDWSISGIEVKGLDDIGARVAEIEMALYKKQTEEENRFKDACRIYRTLAEMFPNHSSYQIEMKLEYLKKNLWKVQKEVEG